MRRFMIAVSLAALTACGGGTPTSPSGYDPSKPIGPGNVPPGPGEGVRASATYAVFAEDCEADPKACSKDFGPTDRDDLKISGTEKTYVLEWNVKYTLRLCVAHPEVTGRKIAMKISGFLPTVFLDLFDESEKRSPVCIARSFSSLTAAGENHAEAWFNEARQDLLTPTDWRVKIGFRLK